MDMAARSSRPSHSVDLPSPGTPGEGRVRVFLHSEDKSPSPRLSPGVLREGVKSAITSSWSLKHVTTSWMTCLLIVLSCSHAWADETISFKRDIAPILAQQCQSCHGPQKSKGKFRLDTFKLLSSPGASKHAPITSGKPAQSEIYLRLTTPDEDDRMPQKSDPLP